MTERDAYVQKMKGQLDEWNAEIDKLQAQAEQKKGDAKLAYEQQINSLRQQRDDAQARLAGLQDSTGEAWEQLKAGVDEAWSSLKVSVERAASAFR